MASEFDTQIRELKTFYGVETLQLLVKKQAEHIERLQQKFHEMNRLDMLRKRSQNLGTPRA